MFQNRPRFGGFNFLKRVILIKSNLFPISGSLFWNLQLIGNDFGRFLPFLTPPWIQVSLFMYQYVAKGIIQWFVILSKWYGCCLWSFNTTCLLEIATSYSLSLLPCVDTCTAQEWKLIRHFQFRFHHISVSFFPQDHHLWLRLENMKYFQLINRFSKRLYSGCSLQIYLLI